MTELKKEILIVEDDHDLMDLVSYNLIQEGYKIRRASSGLEALWSVQQQGRPHCILLDLRIPSPNGYELCEYLKTSEDLRDIPLIIISADSEGEGIEKAMEAGADTYLPKPFSISSLLRCIQRYTSRGSGINSRYEIRFPHDSSSFQDFPER